MNGTCAIPNLSVRSSCIINEPHEMDIGIYDLYPVSSDRSRSTVPFIFDIQLVDASGARVSVRANVDDGAMTAAIDISVYNALKEKLQGWKPTARRFQMADGRVVPGIAKWEGYLEIKDGIRKKVEAEVFDSGGSWNFLFGKPLLELVKAVHNYKVDEIEMPTAKGKINICNEASAQMLGPEKIPMGKRTSSVGGIDAPPSRGVSQPNVFQNQHWFANAYFQVLDSCEQFPNKAKVAAKANIPTLNEAAWASGEAEIPTKPIQADSSREPIPKDRVVVREEQRRRDSVGGNSAPPSRGVSSEQMSTNHHLAYPDYSTVPICVIDESVQDDNPTVGGSDLIPEGLDSNARSSVFTRNIGSDGAFRPERVEEVLKQVKIGTDLTAEQRSRVISLITAYADCFALSVSEVRHVPGAVHCLNVPPGTRFNTKVRQKSFSPPQKAYLHEKIDELVQAGVIEPCSPSQVKCVSPLTMAKKALW